MDSKVVDRAIRQRLWPLLRAAGFTRFTARTAWRYVGPRIEVVNLQSCNSHFAGITGTTTYSFSLNLGSYLVEVPSPVPGHPKQKDEVLVPQEFECHLRGRLHRSFAQPELERRDIWHVDPAGEYLEPIFEDARSVLGRAGEAWFEALRDSRAVYAILVNEPEDNDRLWGFGSNPSPTRSYFLGYLAMALREWDMARKHLGEALQSGCFGAVADRLARDVAACPPPMESN